MLNSHHSAPIPGPECLLFADLLPLLGENTLLEPEASEARAHLATCAYCRQEHAAYQRIEANLRRHFGALPELRFSPEDLLMLSDDITSSEPAPDTAPAPLDTKRPRRRRVVSLFSLVAAVLVVVLVVTAIVVSRALPQNTGTTHHVLSTPTPTPTPPPETAYTLKQYDGIDGFQMLSPTEGWAVGSVYLDGTAAPQPTYRFGVLIFHYHGGHWLRAAAPSDAQLGLSSAGLYSITMVSADEGWATGGGRDSQDTSSAFILHYSGGRWTLYGSVMHDTYLGGVQMLSPTDGWLSGGSNLLVSGGHTSVMLHYDGKRWAAVRMPPAGEIGSLDMLSATDGWATGEGTILHYDGRQWSIFQQAPQIQMISMGSASDGWAIGGSPSTPDGTLFWHYNGQQWVQSWTFTSGSLTLVGSVFDLSMDSATDGWAVGAESPANPASNSGGSSFFEHYSQGHWTRVSAPHSYFLAGVTMLSADEGWALGNGGIILHYQHGTWSLQYQV